MRLDDKVSIGQLLLLVVSWSDMHPVRIMLTF